MVHNIISPYRIPVFEKLNKYYDLDVLFCGRTAEDRKWNSSIGEVGFSYEVLGNLKAGPITINSGVFAYIFKKDYDVCIVPDNTTNIFTSITVSFISKFSNIPYIVWSESVNSSFRNKGKTGAKSVFSALLQFLKNRIYKSADHIIAYSKKTESFLHGKGINREKISVGSQVMPAELLPEGGAKKLSERFERKTVVLYLGYLTRRKGIHNLINAYKNTSTKDTSLIIAGSGPFRKELEELANGKGDIHFVGYVDGKKKANYYAVADIFVLPTLHDPWGLVINEAMYYGLPIITTKAAGAAELVEKAENGFVVEPDNIEGLQSSIERLVKDRELRKRMSEKSKKFTEAQDLQRAIDPFRKAIDKTLAVNT